jgi:hypothetical protein
MWDGWVQTSRMAIAATTASITLFGGAMVGCHVAHADAVAYLVNVTVRPGYHFSSAEAAMAYGHATCDRVRKGESYAEVMAAVKNDFASPDEYQASYLITQAVNELCPALIWQLRTSAAGYRIPAP